MLHECIVRSGRWLSCQYLCCASYAGRAQSGSQIRAWIHPGRFQRVMQAAVEQAGESVPPEWTEVLDLHKVRLKATAP